MQSQKLPAVAPGRPASSFPTPESGAGPRLMYWFAAAAITVHGLFIGVVLDQRRTQLLESSIRLAESFAQVVEYQTSQAFRGVDQTLQLSVAGMAQLESSGRLNVVSAEELLRSQDKNSPVLRALWVLDAMGRIKYESVPGSTGMDLSDRDYFQIYAAKPETQLYFGKPLQGRKTNIWFLSAARPLAGVHRSFDGVIAAAIDPMHFDTVWKSLDLGAGGSVALFRRDGTLMARSPFDSAAMGKQFTSGPIFNKLLPKSPVGSVQYKSGVDGEVRNFAYRTLSDFPEYVVVTGLSVEMVLAPWKKLSALALTVWVLSSVALLLFCGLLDRAWRQQARGKAEALLMSNRLALATDAASIGVWDWTIHKADQWFATPTYFTAMGYEETTELASRDQWLDRLHPDDKGAVVARIQAVLAGEDVAYEYQARLMHADGAYRWVKVVGRVLERDLAGKPARLIGVRLDITEIKKAGQDLVLSERRLRDLIDGLGPAILVGLTTPEGILLEANRPALAAAGLTLEDVINKHLEDTFWVNYSEESKKQIRGAILRGAQGEPSRFEMQIRGLADEEIIIDFSLQPVRDDAGQISFLVPSASVITERKRAENALRLSEGRYRTLFDLAPDGIAISSRDTHFVDCNASFCTMLGYTHDELMRLRWSDVVVLSEAAFLQTFAISIPQEFTHHQEWCLLPKNGSSIDADVVAIIMPDGNFLAMVRNITNRKLVEAALLESEERYRLLVAQSPYSIAIHQEGKIMLSNLSTMTMFGAKRSSELKGLDVMRLVHPDHQDDAQQRIGRMVAGEQGLYPAEYLLLKLDGTPFYGEVSAAPFIYEGRPAIQVIALDITKRKNAEAALLANQKQLKAVSRRVLQVQEAERRRVAVELHDELGQALTAIKINLHSRDLLLDKSQSQSREDLKAENLRIVEDALQQVRRMALTLRPAVLDDLGLAPALRWLMDQGIEHNGFVVNFFSQLPPGRLLPELETTFFRIAQAGLTNVVRHAQARNVSLTLVQEGETLAMTLQDDGVGFDASMMWARAKAGGSIGVLGMEERASLVGGKFTLESAPGCGTTLRLTCPFQRLENLA